jgi:PAS domain S-box-containing protein
MTVFSSRLLLKAFDLVPSGIVLTDPWRPDNPIVFANVTFCQMTGYAFGDIIGRNCRFLQGRDTNPDTIRQLHHAIMERRAMHCELLNYHKNGAPFWNQLFISPLQDEFNEVRYFIGVQSDVTETVGLRHKEHQAEVMQASASVLSQDILSTLRYLQPEAITSAVRPAQPRQNHRILTGETLQGVTIALQENATLLHTILETGSPEILDHVRRIHRPETMQG